MCQVLLHVIPGRCGEAKATPETITTAWGNFSGVRMKALGWSFGHLRGS
jgi:hypothetical protein